MHNEINRRTVLGTALGLAGAPLFAQEKSGRVLRLITPFPPGGGLDVIARFLSKALAEKLGRPVIVDSKSGGNAIVGTRAAASAAPDGDTLFLGTNSSMVTNPAVMPNLAYQTLVDFTPVARIVGYETVVLVHPDSRFKTFGDIIAEGK
ncbi:MAG: Bug family tripartite tricarboxylate transporter substrate binding protein, partial [Anaerolineales bacterium]